MSVQSSLKRWLLGHRPSAQSLDVDVLRVESIETLDQRTALMCGGVSGPATFIVSSVPSVNRARSLCRIMRVDRVDIVIIGSSTTAEVTGRGHRLPTRRPIPTSVALGLASIGIATRVLVEQGEPDD